MNGDRFPTFLTGGEVDLEPTQPKHQCVPGCACQKVFAAADRLRGSVRFLSEVDDPAHVSAAGNPIGLRLVTED